MQKRFNPGPAARNGVTAARMAQLGFTGTDAIFEGERAFLKAFTDKTRPEALSEGAKGPYELLIEFKPYSCARPIHNAIDCALEVRKEDGLDLKEIEAIYLDRHPDWAQYHQNKSPQTYHEAQVSLPFSVAVALIEGKALLQQYSNRNIRNAEAKRLSNLVRINEDPSLPRGVSCRMTVNLKGGRRVAAQVDYPKGSIQNPMSEAEMQAKFDSLATPVIGPKKAASLAEQVLNLEKVGDVAELISLDGGARDVALPFRACRISSPVLALFDRILLRVELELALRGGCKIDRACRRAAGGRETRPRPRVPPLHGLRGRFAASRT